MKPEKTEKTYLDKLTPTTRAYKVKVKVKEKSRVLISPNKKTRYQQLVLEDEKGNKIRGALFENQIDEFSNVLKHEHEYEIVNAPLKPVQAPYAKRENDCQMSFGGQTIIQPVNLDAKEVLPSHRSIAAVPHTTDVADRFDVLGIILFVEQPRKITTSYGVDHMVRELVITDHSIEQPMTISAWDDLALEDSSTINFSGDSYIVMGFTALKPTTHKGFSLATSMSTSFITNPNDEKSVALRTWVAHNHIILSARRTRVVTARNPDGKRTVLSIANIRLKEATTTLQEERHWLKVHVPEPEQSKIVVYVGCNMCGKRTEYSLGESFSCQFCPRDDCTTTPRITFKFDVADDTGTMTFTIFSDECATLFNLPIADIYTMVNDGTLDFESIADNLKSK